MPDSLQPVDLLTSALDLRVQQHLADAKAPNTRRAYTSHWRQFTIWAETQQGQALPATTTACGWLPGRSGRKRSHGLHHGRPPGRHPARASAGWTGDPDNQSPRHPDPGRDPAATRDHDHSKWRPFRSISCNG